ncbi:FIST N-terminal domain-containing protein [Clostridium sp. C2-6-12]|uniref:FIST signal transduction protein n=1 Tax=Clostridium sp. C2-6-12 TaxID=2698832 RepID=UPI00136EC09E|nr:FIST N-terminal domain-containing protein [Clostridium sp. C2-6-12]
MIAEQFIFNNYSEVKDITKLSKVKADLVLAFGTKEFICNKKIFDIIKNTYSKSYIVGCTTAGEIYENQVDDDTLTITAINFEKTELKLFSTKIENIEDSYKKGAEIGMMIPRENLKHVFLITEGENINGSKFVEGLAEALPKHVKKTGGLAGSKQIFKDTFVIANDYAERNLIAAIAFYGDKIKIGYGCIGGWDTFGIERLVTKSKGNIVYELDRHSILDLYNEYLGEYAKDLPGSGLFFPLEVRSPDNKYRYVRTVADIDKENRSLRFAGEIPEGYYARLMRANNNDIISGSMEAAEKSLEAMDKESSKLAILISCIGRRVVLKQMVDEEIEAVRSVFGKDVIFTGFYSFGEIAPSITDDVTAFHNQTMTITLIGEE